jgi:hypothetical protein
MTAGGSSTVHIYTQAIWHPVAAVQYTFTHKQYDTRWQQYSTHLHTSSMTPGASSTVHIYTQTQYTEQHNETEYPERDIHNNENI